MAIVVAGMGFFTDAPLAAPLRAARAREEALAHAGAGQHAGTRTSSGAGQRGVRGGASTWRAPIGRCADVLHLHVQLPGHPDLSDGGGDDDDDDDDRGGGGGELLDGDGDGGRGRGRGRRGASARASLPLL